MSLLPDENIYGHTKKLKYILSHIDQFKNLKKSKIDLLDFGCGNGNAVSRYLINDGTNYYGVDIHAPSLEYASKNYSSMQAKFSTKIPYGKVFDIIVYADILEHLENPKSVIKEHSELLADDGIMIGAVPNGFGPFEVEKRIARYLFIDNLTYVLSKTKYYLKSLFKKKNHEDDVITYPFEPPYNIDSGHIQFFTKKSLYDLFASSNLKVVEFKNGAFLGAPVLTSRVLSNKHMIKFNTKIADYLPYYFVSTWYFTISKA